ncbi:MAG: hypothetical protein ACOYLN_04010, partial [Blastocatellia bacterium]
SLLILNKVLDHISSSHSHNNSHVRLVWLKPVLPLKTSPAAIPIVIIRTRLRRSRSESFQQFFKSGGLTTSGPPHQGYQTRALDFRPLKMVACENDFLNKSLSF